MSPSLTIHLWMNLWKNCSGVVNDESTVLSFINELTNSPNSHARLEIKECTIHLTPIVPFACSRAKPAKTLKCRELERHSIFDSIGDENVFLDTFISYILKVSYGEYILKEKVWNRATCSKFSELFSKFNAQFPYALSQILFV